MKRSPAFCGTKCNVGIAACNGGEKNISQPKAYLDLGQSEVFTNGANPDGCAKEQPLKTLREADIIRLECRERKERAFSEMKWSVKRTNDCNEMKRYCGCISPTERRKRPCEDEERTAEKIRLSRLWLDCLIFLCCEVSVERRKARPTGTAERNKGNDRRETI